MLIQKHFRFLLASAIFLLGMQGLFLSKAFAKYKVPWLSGPIVDEVGVINPQHQQAIDALLMDIHQSGLAQVQVYVTASLQGLPIEQASIEIVDQWKLGDAKKDNGLLFLIAPNERKVRIEVGQGLEGVMPDVYTKRINENVVLPYFKQGDMSEGIYQGVKAIVSVVQGDQLQEAQAPRRRARNKVTLPWWIIVLIWILIFVINIKGGRGGRRLGGGWGYGGTGGFGGGGWGSGGGGWSGGGGGFSGGGSSSSW
jgi:uncharacterized protein